MTCPPQAHQVHVVVFHALVSSELVVNHAGTDPRHFVGGDTGSDSAAANCDAAVDFAGGDRLSQGNHKIRVSVVRIEFEGAKVHHFVIGFAQQPGYVFFQRKTSVVAATPTRITSPFLKSTRAWP